MDYKQVLDAGNGVTVTVAETITNMHLILYMKEIRTRKDKLGARRKSSNYPEKRETLAPSMKSNR